MTIVDELIPAPDPAECCARFAGLPYRLFLDSASRDARLGRHSFLCADPVALVRSRGEGEVLDRVRALLAPHARDPVAGLPPFQGGAAGYIAYDWGLALERLPAPRYDDLDLDDVVLGIYDWVIAWDHQQHRAWLISTGIPETSAVLQERRARERAAWVRTRLEPAVETEPGLFSGESRS